MKNLHLILASLLSLSAVSASAQNFEVPAGYVLQDSADYSKYTKDIIDAAKWLEATPLNEQTEKRREVSKFVIEWVSGSPHVSVEINQTILDFDKANAGMMVIYMASSARYVLENAYSKNVQAKHKAALTSMMNVYNSGKGIKKDKKMLALIKSNQDGKLDAWLEENMKF